MKTAYIILGIVAFMAVVYLFSSKIKGIAIIENSGSNSNQNSGPIIDPKEIGTDILTLDPINETYA